MEKTQKTSPMFKRVSLHVCQPQKPMEKQWFLIRRPESACSSNNPVQNPNRSVNPKSKIRNPKSEIQNPKSKIKIQNPKSKIQNPRSKIQNPKSKIQDPKSKIQNPNGRVWGCHIKKGYYDNPKSKIQNPKSKIQDPKSKIQHPRSKIQEPKSKIQNPRSKIQNPKSKIQDPKSGIQNQKSKRPIWILEFGFGWPGWGGYVANALVWMDWPPKFGVVGRDPSLQAKGRRLDSPRARLKLGPDFQMVVLLATDASSPVSWKLGANFQKKGGGLWCAKQLFYGFNFANAGRKRK